MKPLAREQQQQLGNSFWLDVLSFAHRSISRQSTNRWQENKSRYWFIDEELGPLPITHERKKDHGANYKDGSRSRKWIGKKKNGKQATNDGWQWWFLDWWDAHSFLVMFDRSSNRMSPTRKKCKGRVGSSHDTLVPRSADNTVLIIIIKFHRHYSITKGR